MNSNPVRQSRIWGELVLGSENNTPDETNGVNNAVSCCKETVQLSSVLRLLCHCLPVFDEICGTATDFVFLSSQ